MNLSNKFSKKIIKVRDQGISLRKLNILLGSLTFFLSVILLLFIYRSSESYKVLLNTTENYIDWQHIAYEMQLGSDYLTEQVRCFVVTGDVNYLNNYFTESNVTQRRDKALEQLGEHLSGTKAYEDLNSAMTESMDLMNREYYAMRLAIASFGYDISEFPSQLQSIRLTLEDANLSPEHQLKQAQTIVFDESYHSTKEMITQNVQMCVTELENTTASRQNDASEELHTLIMKQQILVYVLLLLVFLIVLLTSFLIIRPLTKAIVRIRSDSPLSLKGSYEFRFLAKTYNLMYKTNRESKEKLAYEASHDALTNLYNRSGYDFLMENVDWSTSALLLIDVDKFKGVNDTYGHDIGDRMIVRVASILQESFRAQDYICRIGGDEFAVIMLHVDAKSTELIRKKIQSINDALKNVNEDLPPASISVGVAFGSSAHSTGSIFKDADLALYQVKENGRHGCAFFE